MLTFVQFEADTQSGLKLTKSIEINTKHYVEILSQAVDELLPEPSADVS